MATSVDTIEFITSQLTALEFISSRKMFGEYALYYKNKVVALICDDTLFIKNTEPGKHYAKGYFVEAPAYPGGKLSLEIDSSKLDDTDWLCELVTITFDALPEPKEKRKKKLVI